MKKKSVSSEKEPISIRFAINGGNRILNAVVCAYAALKRHGSEGLLNKFHIEFLLIPTSRCDLADWLARQDSWYNRHVYIPLQSELFVAPWIDYKSKPKTKPVINDSCLTKFYRDITESYARESNHSVDICIWECQAWYDNNNNQSTKTPDVILPFVERVELGMR